MTSNNTKLDTYEKERIVLGYDNIRLFELLEEWRKEVCPNDRAYLGAVNFLEYIIK